MINNVLACFSVCCVWAWESVLEMICLRAWLGRPCPCLSRPLVHWFLCLVAAVSLCVPVSGDKVSSHVIIVLLFCLSIQTPVFWLSCLQYGLVALPKISPEIKIRMLIHMASPCWMGADMLMRGCARVNLRAWVCLLYPVFLQYFGIAVSKAHSSQWDKPGKKGIHFYFYIMQPKGMLI